MQLIQDVSIAVGKLGAVAAVDVANAVVPTD